jgi:RNA polymerase sigma-54 factor
MAIAQRLQFKQNQQLVMTPQLQQAIKLLQYTNLELSDYLDEQIERNPLLKIGASEATGTSTSDPAPDAEVDAELEHSAESSDSVLRSGDDSSAGDDAPLDVDLDENVFNNDFGSDLTAHSAAGLETRGLASPGNSGFDNIDRFNQGVGNSISLRSHVEEQIKMLRLAPRDRIIAAYLIDLLDDAGYLSDGLAEAPERLGCTADDVERVRGLLQGLEPTGIFASHLQECLAIQLKEQDRLDPCMAALLDNLDLVARRELAALKRVCRVDAEDLAEMINEIHALNPKPGLKYSDGEPIQPVVPDVFVRKNPTGAWTVELNSETLPRVLVNNQYYAELASSMGSKKEKTYLSDCLSNANWLVKALDQRARTILKVAREIVRQQQAFFEHGVRQLKPLNLRTVAAAISMHESTVSRVTANKYIGTSRGILEMKYFFTSGISSASGEAKHSAESVKDQIRELIDREDPKAILSDDRIVEILVKERIDIARRTVAKYREAMRIPSSVQRRREKNIRL